MDTVKFVGFIYFNSVSVFGGWLWPNVRTFRCIYRIGGSVMVLVTLVHRGNLRIKLITRMYRYLRVRLQDVCLCTSA